MAVRVFKDAEPFRTALESELKLDLAGAFAHLKEFYENIAK